MISFRALGWIGALALSFIILAGAGIAVQAESSEPAAAAMRHRPVAAQRDSVLPAVMLPTIEVRPDEGARNTSTSTAS